MEEDDDLGKRRQILEIFREKFQSETVQEHHQVYLSRLNEQLNQWKSETNDKMKEFIKDKMEEIDQLYDQYCEEFNDKYTDIKREIENNDSSMDINDQIDNFRTYCQSNTIENCIRLHTKPFSQDQLIDHIQLEYMIYPDPSSRQTMKSLESPVRERRIGSTESSPKKKTVESLDSSTEESVFEPSETVAKKRTVETSESSDEEKISKPLKSPVHERTVERTDSSTRTSTGELSNSPVAEKTIESSESFIKRRIAQTFESPAQERTIKPLEPPVQERRTTEPLQSAVRDRNASIHSTRTSSKASPVSLHDYPQQVVRKDRSSSKRQSDPSKEEPIIYHPESRIRRTSDDERKNLTRLYVGKCKGLTPILVGKDREVYNETEKTIEYSIDSIPLPRDRKDQSSDPTSDSDNEMKIVRAYKVLIQEETDYKRISTSSSDHEEDDDDDDDDEELSNINNKLNLKKFNQINYSTIMFRKCETEYNSLSSSTRRNELLLFNSKLKILIILQHDNHQQCRQRFYLHWPKNISSNISDITYCHENDHFLISTWDTSRMYLFNRHLFSINDLGQLANDSPLRRIHCYQQTVYCIISNNYLLEFQINGEYSQLQIVRKIKLFDPMNRSQDTCYHLIDITCDENYLVIIYSNEHDEIRLQSIYRQTRKFHQDILLDTRQPINQNYIRIESTYVNGNFLYLNGSQQHMKAIDLVNYNKGKITSIMRRHTKPTNISFLRDRRLVILYEHPYFLSVHDLSTRQEDN